MTLSKTRYIPSWCIVVLVAILSLAPIGIPEPLRVISLADKWSHMLMYGMTTLLLFADQYINERRIAWTATIIAMIIYGTILEGVQYFIPYRSYDPLDIAANAIGVVLAAAMAATIQLICKKKPHKI